MNISEFILSGKTLLLDGATGSQLIAKGLISGECPELWNINRKLDVREIAKSYFDAGSDAVLTNTFGASKIKLKTFQLEHRIEEINRTAALLAISVKPSNGYVLGSIGTSGTFLEPFGEISEDEMIESYYSQIKPLTDAGVDGFVLETFSDLAEITCAIKAIKEYSLLPFFASLTFQINENGIFTMMGADIPTSIELLTDLGALVIGSNCGNGIEKMLQVGKKFREHSSNIKLMLESNAGEPFLENGTTVYKENEEYFEKFKSELIDLHPAVIGGCCGTTPGHIRTLRTIINQM